MVCFEIFFFIVEAFRFPESKSTSAKTGVAPTLITDETEAIKDLGVTITSSPSEIPRPLKARSRATVPLATAIEYLAPHQEENSLSNFFPSSPVQ